MCAVKSLILVVAIMFTGCASTTSHGLELDTSRPTTWVPGHYQYIVKRYMVYDITSKVVLVARRGEMIVSKRPGDAVIADIVSFSVRSDAGYNPPPQSIGGFTDTPMIPVEVLEKIGDGIVFRIAIVSLATGFVEERVFYYDLILDKRFELQRSSTSEETVVQIKEWTRDKHISKLTGEI